MKYLTADQVLFIHYRLISETGGDHGVNDPAGLAATLRNAKYRLEDIHFPHSLFRTAAVLLHSLVNTSFFRTGNLATAIAVIELLLRINGYHLVVDQQELQEFLKKIKKGGVEINQIEHWLQNHVCS